MKIEKDKGKVIIAYCELNYAFGMSSTFADEYEIDGIYKPLPILDNKYGINAYIYSGLGLYNKETSKNLTYDKVVDYFSQEYETDGSLRLYNNGSHPDIGSYVIWAQNRRGDIEKYEDRLDEVVYTEYFINNMDKGFKSQVFYSLSPQMLDELIKKEANPDYEMDLLSLQEQGY